VGDWFWGDFSTNSTKNLTNKKKDRRIATRTKATSQNEKSLANQERGKKKNNNKIHEKKNSDSRPAVGITFSSIKTSWIYLGLKKNSAKTINKKKKKNSFPGLLVKYIFEKTKLLEILPKTRSLSAEDNFLMVLYRMRHSSDFKTLQMIFGSDETTLSKNFNRFLPILVEFFRPFIELSAQKCEEVKRQLER